jgi:hypothetical protein
MVYIADFVVHVGYFMGRRQESLRLHIPYALFGYLPAVFQTPGTGRNAGDFLSNRRTDVNDACFIFPGPGAGGLSGHNAFRF